MANFDALDSKIVQLNARLKAARMGLQIERRGQKLNLRGTLPPRPDSDRLKPHQQRLSLNLPATQAGLKQAEQEVKVIAAELIQNTFDWRKYHIRLGRISQLELAQKIEAFTEAFFNEPQRQVNPAATKTTWESAYQPYLRKLAAIAQQDNLSLEEAIHATIKANDVNSRSRQVCCTALAAFANFLQLPLELDFNELNGGYNNTYASIRKLPPDDLIAEIWQKIPNPAWRFVYGMMATYGLRNHEVFFCDFFNLQHNQTNPTIRVLASTKTGEHEVWPFYPEWVETFQLHEVCLPQIQLDLNQTTLQRIGQRVTAQFRRYKVPFSPYDLRHAWAIRTIHFGLPDAIAAKMMGHSIAIHNRTYHQWITHRDQAQAVEAALQKTKLSAPHL